MAQKQRKLPLRPAPELEHLFPAKYGWGDDRGKVPPKPKLPLAPKYGAVNALLHALRLVQEGRGLLSSSWQGEDWVLLKGVDGDVFRGAWPSAAERAGIGWDEAKREWRHGETGWTYSFESDRVRMRGEA